ncbi:MAG: AraC family transcriptional regulator [Clostridia bacterium]|nr:AraC family transcriptional regulator [Clostridia bacterium]
MHQIVKDNTVLLKVFHAKVKKGVRINRMHRHTEFEISLVLKGKGEYTLENVVHPMEQGDMFLFSTDEQHCITKTESDEMELLTLQFSPRFLWAYGNRTSDFKALKIFFNRNEKFSNRLLSTQENVKKLSDLLCSIENELEQKRPEYDLMVKADLISLLVHLIRDFDYIRESDSITPRKQNIENMEKVMAYMDSHITENLTLEGLSKIAMMSKSYFSTTFKHLNGISLWDYIAVKRVELAISYLKETNKTMLEIATLCGYNNTANFNRTFRKVTGKTPKSYRKE